MNKDLAHISSNNFALIASRLSYGVNYKSPESAGQALAYVSSE